MTIKGSLEISAAFDLVTGDAAEDERALASDPRSIVGGLYRSHARKVRSYLGFRLRDREAGNDAAQDVFLKLWRYESRGHLREESTSYMYAATQSAIADAERWRVSHGYGQDAPIEAESLPAGDHGEDDRVHWREALAHLAACVGDLPRTTGDVFLMSYLEGLTYPRIAKVLGISERTVERHLVRAMTELRARMKDYL
jgi:RNA polymerase sigma-70 factor (ECF subfamily)